MVKDPIVAVIGDGSWATALVHLLSENVRKVQWWVRNLDRSTYIKQNGCNPSYLSGLVLNTKKVKPITNPVTAAINNGRAKGISCGSFIFIPNTAEKILNTKSNMLFS